MFYFYLNEEPERVKLEDSKSVIQSLMGSKVLESDFCKRE